MVGALPVSPLSTSPLSKSVESDAVLTLQNDTFASTSNFLGGTFRRMNNMAKRQGGNWCWFMGFLLLCIWIFVVVWWLRR
jgi:blocked-early-in-transport protein 1